MVQPSEANGCRLVALLEDYFHVEWSFSLFLCPPSLVPGHHAFLCPDLWKSHHNCQTRPFWVMDGLSSMLAGKWAPFNLLQGH